MFRTLRNRLILSHILPAVLIIPLMGAAMLYVLETRLLLPMVYNDLATDAALMAEITRNQPVFWQNPEAAHALVRGVTPYLSGGVSLINLQGVVLASDDTSGSAAGNEVIDLPQLSSLQPGEVVQMQSGPVAEVFTPVIDLTGRPIGIIRMTTRVVTVSDEVYELRYLLGGVLILGILGGVGLGSYLAFGINRPIQLASRSIEALATGQRHQHVEERGPDELRSLAITVNGLVDQLNSIESSRRHLLANLVHELGRPLGAIRSAVQALQRGADRDRALAKDLLNGIDGETARLQHLLDDLAGLYEQLLGKLELHRVPISLNNWLAATLSPWEAAAREKNITWTEDVPRDLPAIVMDPERLAQALGNLLSNAVKFTSSGGTISISVSAHDGRFMVRVVDTGPGIPAGERAKVFQPFYRGADGRRIVEGMGLGLSIAHDIAAALHGGIEIQDTDGRGSCFLLWIPLDLPKED